MNPRRTLFRPLPTLLTIGAIAGVYVWANTDTLVTQYVNQELDAVLSIGDFSSDIRSADFVPGLGLTIHGLRIGDKRNADQILLESESIVIRFATDISTILSGQSKPLGIDIKHLRIAVEQTNWQSSLQQRIQTVIDNKPNSDLIPIRLRNSKLSFAAAGAAQPVVLENVGVDLIPKAESADKEFDWALTADSRSVRKLKLSGHSNMTTGAWQAELHQANIQLSEQIFDSVGDLPEPARRWLEHTSGRIQLSAFASRKSKKEPVRFATRGSIVNLNVREPQLESDIENVSGEFLVNSDGVKLTNFRGKIGSGEFEFNYQQTGLLKRRTWQVSGSGKQLFFDSRYRGFLTAGCQRLCDDFSPKGFFDLQFSADSSGKKSILSKMTDISFSFHKFPFLVQHVNGEINWQNDEIKFGARANDRNQLLEFSGKINNPGPASTFVIEFGTDGLLPIDDKSIGALSKYPNLQKAIADLRPTGFFNGWGRLVKSSEKSDYIRKELRIGLHHGSVRHRKFDYPIQNVKGTILSEDEEFKFTDFTGSNGTATVRCSGGWAANSGLDLVFDCRNVDLNDRLRHALSPTIQEVWDGLRPAGVLQSAKVHLDLPRHARYADIRLNAQLGDSATSKQSHRISIFPQWFPYELRDIQGEIEIGDGKIALREIFGRHGKTKFSCNVDGIYGSENWAIKLQKILASSISVDESLLSALPTHLAQAIRHLKYKGQLNLTGEFGFAGSNETNLVSVQKTENRIRKVTYEQQLAPIDVDWDIRLDVDQADMLVGVPLENVFGSVRLEGRSKGERSLCTGQIAIDSLMLFGLQVTNVQGPIWIDNLETKAGKFAAIKAERTQSLTGDLGHGEITFDGRVSNEGDFPFFLQCTVDHAKLAEIVPNVSADLNEVAGDGYGFLRLKGNANEPHTYNGLGSAHLSNAKIQELPVILALLKILNIKEVNRTAFDSSNVDFLIEGNRIKLNRIELIGDAISLIGNGYLELMRHVDVNFYSVVGRNRLYIPLISELYRAGSQRILWINIAGPFEKLQTSRKVLPGLDDSLRKLLGNSEAQNRNSERR